MAYDKNFIGGFEIPLPVPSERVLADAHDGGFIHHSRYSLLFNTERGFAHATAHNIDGKSILSKQVSSRSFRYDPLIKPVKLQTGNKQGYSGLENHWDRGHLVRRKSMSWGSKNKAEIAERESDYYSNITPQHQKLHSASWGKIEDWMMERVESSTQRACVFAGPVFTIDDPTHKNHPDSDPIRIPAGFWKIIALELNGNMRSAGFLVWQRDYDSPNPLPFSPILEQVRLTTIEVLSGLVFPSLREFDPLLFGSDKQLKQLPRREGNMNSLLKKIQPSAKAEDFEKSKIILSEISQPRSTAIMNKDDIIL